jgi:hypothetical protein
MEGLDESSNGDNADWERLKDDSLSGNNVTTGHVTNLSWLGWRWAFYILAKMPVGHLGRKFNTSFLSLEIDATSETTTEH